MSEIKIELLKEVKAELKRLDIRIDEAVEALSEDKWKVKEFAAVKRGAMDLKQTLVKITQFGKYENELLEKQRKNK